MIRAFRQSSSYRGSSLNRFLEPGRRRESGREASDGPSQFSRCCSLTSYLSKATSSG